MSARGHADDSAASEHHDRDGGQEPQASEDGSDVRHVRLLTLVEDGRPIDLDREVAAEHEVGQDGVGRGAQLARS